MFVAIKKRGGSKAAARGGSPRFPCRPAFVHYLGDEGLRQFQEMVVVYASGKSISARPGVSNV